jgi:predicted regulator of Ras-like GTPase activity (Roadblock/LC7/MglB family)
MDADRVAQRALREAELGPADEISPGGADQPVFATRTMAELLERRAIARAPSASAPAGGLAGRRRPRRGRRRGAPCASWSAGSPTFGRRREMSRGHASRDRRRLRWAIGAALMGNDGVPDRSGRPGPGESGLGEEIGSAGVEFGRILDEIRKASDAMSAGAVHETVIMLARFTLIFRSVDAETFLVVFLTPDGNLGKARYLIRRQLPAIRQEF